MSIDQPKLRLGAGLRSSPRTIFNSSHPRDSRSSEDNRCCLPTKFAAAGVHSVWFLDHVSLPLLEAKSGPKGGYAAAEAKAADSSEVPSRGANSNPAVTRPLPLSLAFLSNAPSTCCSLQSNFD